MIESIAKANYNQLCMYLDRSKRNGAEVKISGSIEYGATYEIRIANNKVSFLVDNVEKDCHTF